MIKTIPLHGHAEYQWRHLNAVVLVQAIDTLQNTKNKKVSKLSLIAKNKKSLHVIHVYYSLKKYK